MKPKQLTLLGLLTVAFLATSSVRLTADDTLSLFDRKNISALWIAAPWDAKKRGPEERMQMLRELGLSKFAYNGDGAVDAADLASLLAAWGACRDCSADVDGDGAVGGWDLSFLLNAWGRCG
jgi:hypothetical protein